MAQYDLSTMRRPSVPLHVEVADLIRNQILSGEMAVGARLPSIKHFSESMKLANMTVRQAMDSLEAEGFIDRQPGRGTFVKNVAVRHRQFLRMEADIDQLFRTVEGLEVSIATPAQPDDRSIESSDAKVGFKRMHILDSEPFCVAELSLDRAIYTLAPERFETEIVILVLRDLKVPIASARQWVKITFADAEQADALKVHVNSPLMQVHREFSDDSGSCIYSAILTYPGDSLGFEIEFKV